MKNCQLFFVFFFLISISHVNGQNISINEIMASNAATIADEDGDYEDWIELINYGTQPINLNGFGLSDDYDNPFRWVFPDVSIAPGEYLMVWASGKNRHTPGEPLHTNFSISAAGEEVILTHPDGTFIDEHPPTPIPTDLSYGRQPDGTGEWFYFDQPTPGESNTSQAYSEILSPPVFSHSGGFYTEGFDLSLSHPAEDISIVYTLDGSEPSQGNLNGTTYGYKISYPQNPGDPIGDTLYNAYYSHLYTQPLQVYDRSGEPDKLTHISTTVHLTPDYFPLSPVNKGMVIRAKAIKPGALPSPVVTQSYFVTSQPHNPYDLPLVSINLSENNLFDYYDGMYVAGVVFDTWRTDNPDVDISDWHKPGNFSRRGNEWEYPASIELFEPASATATLKQNVGIRIHGGVSRTYRVKSLRIYARSMYGQSTLDYQFFPNTDDASFKRLLLRNSGQDFNRTLFRDAAIQEIVRHLDFDTQEYQPVIVYINGEFWGIHNIRERYDKHYLARVYGVDEDNIDLLEINGLVKEGDAIHYNAMLHYMAENNMAEDAHYQYIKTLMDADNFIDYQIAQIFARNTDWPGKNIDYWRLRTSEYNPNSPYGHDGRWRWLFYDLDFGFGAIGGEEAYTHNTLDFATATGGTAWPNPDWSTFLLRTLLTNEAFRNDFINRFADHLNTTFLPGRMIGIINEMKEAIEAYVPDHIHRWKRPWNIGSWENSVDVMVDFANQRPYYQRLHIREYFEIECDDIIVHLDLNEPEHGHIRINTLDIEPETEGVSEDAYPWTGLYFYGIPIEVEAIARPGYAFSHWEGCSNDDDALLNIVPTDDITLTAHFVETDYTEPQLMYFWVFDGDMPNNTPLEAVDATYNILHPGQITYHSSLAGYPFDPSHPNWRKASMERRNAPTNINYRPEGNNGISFESADMRGLQIRQPFTGDGGENTMIFHMPTSNFTDVVFQFAATDEGAADYIVADYCVDEHMHWTSDGLLSDTLWLTGMYHLCMVDLSGIEEAGNNPWFAIRLRFGGSDMAADDGNRVTFNNISLDGVPVDDPKPPPYVASSLSLKKTTEGGETMIIDIDDVFGHPEGAALSFSAQSSLSDFVETTVDDHILEIDPLQRGDAKITLFAMDGVNPAKEHSFRVLVYPKAHDLGEGVFSFSYWDENEPERQYPENMLFLQSDLNDPGLDDVLLYPYHIAHDDYHEDDQGSIGFPYNNTGRTRINGLGEEGISFINTGRGRDLGGALTAINTLGAERLWLQWLGGTILQNSRTYAIRLQYRIGTDGMFADLLHESEVVEYVSAGDGHLQLFEAIELPEHLMNEPYVQLLWKYYHVSGNSGPRAQLRLDDIIIGDLFTGGFPVAGDPRLDLRIYPNPARKTITIRANTVIKKVKIFDMMGNMLYNAGKAAKQAKITVSGFNAGVYVLQVQTKKAVKVKTFKVQR